MQNIKDNNFKINLRIWDLYFAFILAMPYGVFSSTAIVKLEQPASVIYYRISVFYLSILFIPFIFFSIFHIGKKTEHIAIRPLLLITLLFLKDIFGFLVGTFPNLESYWFSTYCNYIVASLYFVCVACIYRENIDDFLKIYALVNIATLLFSIVSGIGQEVLSGRSHMAALHHGETAAVLSILTLYFAIRNEEHINWWVLGAGGILILATGNRKDLAFILVCLLIFLMRKRTLVNMSQVSRRRFVLSFFGVVGVLAVITTVGYRLLSLIDISRYIDMFFSIRNQGLSGFITGDGSFLGRIDSIRAGLNAVGDHPILGSMFSLVNCQMNMQHYGYPTFPHSTVLYLYCVMGVFAIIPVFSFIKTGVKLIKQNQPLQYTFIYIFIRDVISGGANEAIKYLLLMMLILNLGKVSVHRHECGVNGQDIEP